MRATGRPLPSRCSGILLVTSLSVGMKRGEEVKSRSDQMGPVTQTCHTKMFCDSVIVRPLSALQTLTDLLVIPTSNSLKQLGFLL